MSFSSLSTAFSLSLLADRFMCGGSALTSGRHISRKRLALIDALPHYPDIEAALLSKEIAAYRKAKSILSSNQFISPETLLKAHACFYSKKFKMGRFRTTQNWIGESLKKAEYIPPAPEKMNTLLNSWFEHANNKLHSLENIATLYAQFILLHPFPDANGRLARALFDVLSARLNKQQLPLGLYRLNVDSSLYISGLNAFGGKSNRGTTHDYWVEAIAWSEQTTAQVTQFTQSARQNMQGKLGIFAITQEEAQVLNYLWQQPIVTPPLLQTTFGWNSQDCSALLQKLCKLGLLTTKKLKHGNNQLIFVCEAVFDNFQKTDTLILSKQKQPTQ